MRFPKIADVAAELRSINEQDTEEDGIDVRLQVYPDGEWAVRWGSSDYDQDHRGYWGASSVPGSNRRFDSKDVARNLIDQARDAHAQGEEGDEELDEETEEELDEETEEAPVRERSVTSPRNHPDVEYSVEDGSGQERVFKTFDEAASFALTMAMSSGEADLDVLIWSEEGAEWYGGDDAVEQYNEDPEASVFERYNITVNNAGRVS